VANEFRGPLFVNGHRKPVAGVRDVVVALTLMPVALFAINNASAAPRQVLHPSHALSVNADTSRGTPKTLTADTLRPAQAQPQSLLDRTRPVVDTSRGTNPALLPPTTAQAPFTILAQPPPDRIRPVADTSLGTPKSLTQDAQQPIGTERYDNLLDRVRPVTDTSRGTAKTLTADAQLPARNLQQTAPDKIRPVADTSLGSTAFLPPAPPVVNLPQYQIDRVRPVADTSIGTDPNNLPAPLEISTGVPFYTVQLPRLLSETSQGSPYVLITQVVSPITFGSSTQSYETRKLPVTDTSQGTPKALTQDAQLPAQNPQHTAPDRVRAVTAQSQGTDPALLPAPLEISTGVPFYTVQLPRLLSETSQSSPVALVAIVAPPFVPFPDYYQVGKLPVTDTSLGTAKALTADAQPPVFNAPQFLIYRQPAVVDTSLGTNVPIAYFIPPAPFYQTDWPAPVPFKQFYEGSVNSTQPPDTIPPAPPAPPTRAKHPGYDQREHNRERYIRLLKQEDDIAALMLAFLASVEGTRNG